jgi:glycosyltransferase involved in cell wall biosynthesis
MARISVVMATYRGTRFLRKQLQGISDQVRPPDEMVICDDDSGDGTIDLAYEFAQRAPFPVLVTRNAVRSGSNEAFNHALGLARGDLIALADQDDVWKPDKLALLEAALERRPEAAMAYCDVQLIDEAGAPAGFLGTNTWRVDPRVDEVEGRDALDFLLARPQACGMSTLFRRQILELALPLTRGGGPEQTLILPPFIHDRWLSLVAGAQGGVVCVNRALVSYRRHPGQQTAERQRRTLLAELRGRTRTSASVTSAGIRRPPEARRDARLNGAPRLEDLRDRLLRLDSPELTSRAMTLVEERLDVIRTRSALPGPRHKRIRPVWRLLRSGLYRRHSRGVLSALADTIR